MSNVTFRKLTFALLCNQWKVLQNAADVRRSRDSFTYPVMHSNLLSLLLSTIAEVFH